MPKSKFFLISGGNPEQIAEKLGGILVEDRIFFSPDKPVAYCDENVGVLIIPPDRSLSGEASRARHTNLLQPVRSDITSLYMHT